jgi:hypothetical protein
MRMINLTVTAGLCAVASCAWAGVSFREGGAAQTTRPPLLSTTVERMHKADRMGGRASNVRGASVPAFSIETANSLESTITLRDSNGSILYQVSPMDRTTTVAKRAARKPVLSQSPESLSPSQSARVEKMPDGCESAFSPYVAPRMANVSGRCVS